MVRAIVEENHYWIDNYLIYARSGTTGHDATLVRCGSENAMFKVDGITYGLTWRNPDGRAEFINPAIPLNAKPVPIESVAVTGDFSYGCGHFYPSKARVLAARRDPILYYLSSGTIFRRQS